MMVGDGVDTVSVNAAHSYHPATAVARAWANRIRVGAFDLAGKEGDGGSDPRQPRTVGYLKYASSQSARV